MSEENRLNGSLRESEAAAFVWLSARPAPTDLSALYSALLTVPYLEDRQRHHNQYVSSTERMLTVTFSLGREPELPILLRERLAPEECRCQDLGDLAVENIYLSGSVREGTDVKLFADEVSDTDVMFQLGPVTWVDSKQEEVKEPPRDASGEDPAASYERPMDDTCPEESFVSSDVSTPDSSSASRVDSQESASSPDMIMQEALSVFGTEGIRKSPETTAVAQGNSTSEIILTKTKTSHPGYFLLHHQRRPACQHEVPLPLSAQRVVALMQRFGDAISPGHVSHSGPSVATTLKDVFRTQRDLDLVACLPSPNWPSEDYSSRPRPSGQPSSALVERLCRTPAFLVPVGFRGSPEDHLQWRLSFSRHEYIMYRSLTEAQQTVFVTLKHCKAIVGAAAAPLKSYYLKTAAFWLCEYRKPGDWNTDNLHASLLAVLRYVEVCVRRRYMPLYFWPEVNLLASRTDEELTSLSEAVKTLQERLLSSALALVADWLGMPVTDLADRLLGSASRMSDQEFWQQCALRAFHDLTHHKESKPLGTLRDLLLGGKIRFKGKQVPFPICSALPFGIEAANVLDRGGPSRGTEMILGRAPGWLDAILKVRRQVVDGSKEDDSWLKED